MEKVFEYTVLGLYGLSLVLIVIYSLGQFHLVVTFLRNRKKYLPQKPLTGDENLPFVTVQLPVYNELYVVERLLDAIAAFDYPHSRFEVQLLDDSDDESFDVAAKKIAALKTTGLQIEHIRRSDRTGFKAGALAYGMEFAKGEFIAIFDADFLPRPSYLRATLANFTDPNIGVVQARWEHLNRGYSLFTEAQAFHLDAHFTIEQFSRDKGGFYINFNGTAGVWRKTCIIDAGGWEADTLTEDLDLSYRAQIRGWKFCYVDEIGTPAELPAEMGAIKSQQYRWMKGGAEVARKMLRRLWVSDASLIRKLHGTLHLLSSSVFILVLLMGAMSVPLLYIKHEILGGNVGFLVIPVAGLLFCFVVLGFMYVIAFRQREGGLKAALKRFTIHYIPFLSFSMGLALHNSLAVIQGYRGKKTPFIRTPKFNLISRSDTWQNVKYKTRKVKPEVWGEFLMVGYFGLGIGMSFYFRDFAVLPFFLMQAAGFAAVSVFSFRHAGR
ncbi:MAG: glycosyltransferase [Bacteroidia bacterium]|nr:glycosyltransferase [Bacteroidia bacterium]